MSFIFNGPHRHHNTIGGTDQPELVLVFSNSAKRQAIHVDIGIFLHNPLQPLPSGERRTTLRILMDKGIPVDALHTAGNDGLALLLNLARDNSIASILPRVDLHAIDAAELIDPEPHKIGIRHFQFA